MGGRTHTGSQDTFTMRARSWMLCGDWVLRGETRQESIHTGDIVCFSVCSRLKPKWKLHWIAIELNCDCDCVYGIQKQTNNTTIILNAQHKHMQIVCTVSSFILSLTLSFEMWMCVHKCKIWNTLKSVDFISRTKVKNLKIYIL